MIVFDEKAYKEKIKCFEEKEEELNKKANEFYIELMNRKEIIKKYWSFSFRSILTAAFIGITIPFTAGASIGVAIGSSIASSAFILDDFHAVRPSAFARSISLKHCFLSV